jgi:NTP pyrophosphatase (non-canonical NTP hydrolase)
MNTEIKNLQQVVKNFCTERDWDQFHSAKDVAIGLSTESAELLELFRFKSDTEVTALFETEDFKQKVAHELADILFFLLRFSQKQNIDLVDAFNSKMQRNSEKYPLEKAKGSNKKYNEF